MACVLWLHGHPAMSADAPAEPKKELPPVEIVNEAAAHANKAPAGAILSADKAWQRLTQGNQRFLRFSPSFPNQGPERRKTLSLVQQPVAAIFTTTDSRTVPEFIFDQGFGDIIVIRSPGLALGSTAIAGLEHAVSAYGIRLVMVLGQERDDVLKEAIDYDRFRTPIKGNFNSIFARLRPSIVDAKKIEIDQYEGEFLENVLMTHIRRTVKALQETNGFLTQAEKQMGLKIIGARYDLDTGSVTLVQ